MLAVPMAGNGRRSPACAGRSREGLLKSPDELLRIPVPTRHADEPVADAAPMIMKFL